MTSSKRISLLGRAAAIAAASLALGWPALLNGFPLLYSDSLEYLGDGRYVALAIHRGGLQSYVATRSEFYAGGLFLLHRGPDIWPVVALQALLTAWIVWLTVRSLLERAVTPYLVLMGLLSVLTGIGWYVSCVMPDVYTAPLCLCLYLLVFAKEEMRLWELFTVAALACWFITVHGSHLPLAAGLCGVMLMLWLLRWSAMRGRALLLATGVVVMAAAAQMALHARIYHKASLFGAPPPFLMARVVADGPARIYLQQHCKTLTWTICKSLDRLPSRGDDFLWPGNGIWQTSTVAERQHLREEQTPLVLATLRAYPLEQLKRSWVNFWQQLTLWGPADFENQAIFIPRILDYQTPGLSRRYQGTLQARDAMPQFFFAATQSKVVLGCLLLALWLMPWVWRSGGPRMRGLTAVVFAAVLLNAVVTGVVSGVFARYEGRVIWLLPMLAFVEVWARYVPGALRRQPTLPATARG